MNNPVATVAAAAASPFTWKGRSLRNPPQPTAWQRKQIQGAPSRLCNANPSSAYVDLAQHWMNKRYVKKPVASLPDDGGTETVLEAVMTYCPWEKWSAHGNAGYRVTIRYHADGHVTSTREETIYLRDVDDNGWVERVAPLMVNLSSAQRIKVEFFTQYNLSVHNRHEAIMARFFRVDEDPEKTYRYALRTSHSACVLFTGLRRGACEATAVVAPPTEGLSHWATITDKINYHFQLEEEHKWVPRTHRTEAAADFDFIYYTWMNLSFVEDKLRWRMGRHSWAEETNVAEEEKRYELFVAIQEKQHHEDEANEEGAGDDTWTKDGLGDIYLHDTTENKWFIVVQDKGSLVRHVRREMKFQERLEQRADSTRSVEGEKWYAVETDFDHSKNPVYMFVKTNRGRTVLNRKIVKPVTRGYYEEPLDGYGRDTLPREIFVNQCIDRMPPKVQDLFSRCERYSFQCPTGVETWNMYLRYEPGGSLSSLFKGHGLEGREQKEMGDADRNPDFVEYWPEIWLWCIFERLVRACERLRRDPAMRDGQWGFVHSDIKASNMLLRIHPDENYRGVQALRDERMKLHDSRGTSKNGLQNVPATDGTPVPNNPEVGPPENGPGLDEGLNKRAHPIPLLTDFEFCFRLGHEKVRAKGGTVGHMAPESYNPRNTSPERLDIFQIGCTMYGLMRGHTNGLPALNPNGIPLDRPRNDFEWTAPVPYEFDVPVTKRHWDSRCDYANMYSRSLTASVDECLENEPSNRPTIVSLLEKVQAGLLAHDKMLGGVLDKKWTEVHEWYRVSAGKEQFQVGSSLGKRKKYKGMHKGVQKRERNPYTNVNEWSHISLFDPINSDTDT